MPLSPTLTVLVSRFSQFFFFKKKSGWLVAGSREQCWPQVTRSACVVCSLIYYYSSRDHVLQFLVACVLSPSVSIFGCMLTCLTLSLRSLSLGQKERERDGQRFLDCLVVVHDQSHFGLGRLKLRFFFLQMPLLCLIPIFRGGLATGVGRPWI